MTILGIETSCDECSAAVVQDGEKILSNIIATQIEKHKAFNGVVPEIASRLHTEWITGVVRRAVDTADITLKDIDAIAVTNRPGLIGALIVGVNFAKALAYSLGIPFIGIDHIRAHLYAAHLEQKIEYPYLGVLVSGGHTIIAEITGFDQINVLGTTIDDAIGEAFDKVAKYYKLGYPGGIAIDSLAKKGNPHAYNFPIPSLHKGNHEFDVSYSGLKTAVINQADQFWDGISEKSNENIAAGFQKTAVDIIVRKIKKALAATGLKRLVVGGGVAANSHLRERIAEFQDLEIVFPSLELCTDNAAMIAGLGYHHIIRGEKDSFTLNASPRIKAFRRVYP